MDQARSVTATFNLKTYTLTLNKAIGALTLSAGLVDASTNAYFGPGGKDLGASRVVVSAKYTF